MNKKDELIGQISKASDQYGDKLLDFMNRYRLTNLMDATVEQLEEYARGMKNDIQRKI